MRLSLNQRGASQIILPLFLIAGIALAVYLSQQQTELTPSAAEPPTGCVKVSPQKRFVRYKNCSSASENCGDVTTLVEDTDRNGENDADPNLQIGGKTVATYPLKESVWEYERGWRLSETKGPRQSDGDRISVSKGRFDVPGGNKGYEETDSDPTSSDGVTRDGFKVEYGSGVVVEFVFSKEGTNYQGLPGKTFDYSKSYAWVPSDPNSSVKCNGTGTTTGTKNANAACEEGKECKSGVCTNKKCAATGNKAGGAACTEGIECQSGRCSNRKCDGGSKTIGAACEDDAECASNICSTTNRCVAPSPSPARGSGSPRASGGGGGGGTNPPASTNPGASTAPGASASASASIAPTTPPGGTTPVHLTKAEITGFANSYKALEAKLPTTSTGNLKIVSGIATTELTSIVSQLPTCPDDANVGTCLDSKFRTRFDLAKTAARLSSFYGIFNGVNGICVKSDLGLNPLITGTSQTGVTGRVNLCTDRLVGTKIWMVFAGGAFTPILSTDTRFPTTPTCQTLPQDVITHYRNAETLFKTQAGFVENTLCDGKTSVAPGGI